MVSLLSAINNTFELFGLTIHWYGVILTTGMICAFLLLLFLGKKNKLDSDFSLTVFLFAIVFAIIGARLFYVLPRADEYFTSWSGVLRAFNISEGGLTIMGGIPCGALGVLCACKIYKKSFFRVIDLIVPCLLLGQVIGRWGNFVNGELYGVEITNPSLQFFPFAVEINGTYHAANFFYESLLNFIFMCVVLFVMFKYKDKIKVGVMSVSYVIWYCLVRGMLEFVKVDQLYWGSVRAVQLVCFLVIPFAVALLVLIQLDKIRLETPKMYDKHFAIVHEPPPYVESVADSQEPDSDIAEKDTQKQDSTIDND